MALPCPSGPFRHAQHEHIPNTRGQEAHVTVRDCLLELTHIVFSQNPLLCTGTAASLLCECVIQWAVRIHCGISVVFSTLDTEQLKDSKIGQWTARRQPSAHALRVTRRFDAGPYVPFLDYNTT